MREMNKTSGLSSNQIEANVKKEFDGATLTRILQACQRWRLGWKGTCQRVRSSRFASRSKVLFASCRSTLDRARLLTRSLRRGSMHCWGMTIGLRCCNASFWLHRRTWMRRRCILPKIGVFAGWLWEEKTTEKTKLKKSLQVWCKHGWGTLLHQ